MAMSTTRRTGPRHSGRNRTARDRVGLWAVIAIAVLAAAFFGVLELSRPHVEGDRLRFDTLLQYIEDGNIRTAEILDEDSYVVGRYQHPDTEEERRYNSPLVKEYQSELVDRLVGAEVETSVEQQVNKRVAGLAAILLPGLILIVLFAYLIISSRRGTGLFKIRSGAKQIESGTGGVTFDDVAGQDAAIRELREVKDFLADPRRYADMGVQAPKGILLYGPPGSGKTLLARALAGDAGANFYSISGSDFVELYVGVGAARVRDLFKMARENTPAVIFIDELDSVGRTRAGLSSQTESEQALNQVLAEMDGFAASEGVVVIAATNRPDVLDPALLRPGRFDRTVGLDRPDEEARRAILAVHARGKPLESVVDLAALAKRAVGLTGADLAGVMNEAGLLAARAGRTAISAADLDEALKRVLEAPERQRRLSLRERSIGRRFSDDDRLTFADVAGQDAAVAELREIQQYLDAPEKYQALGATIPRAVLLYGPPGCGKTLMARALAAEANAAFFSVSATEFVEMVVGRGAARVRDLFAEARQMAPAIVFIDELDSLGRSRGGVAGDRIGAQGEQEQALNQILTELDGFAGTGGVIVLGATNRPDVLDPALLRPGRFDRTIGLELPNAAARLAILTLHARAKVLAPDADLEALAERAHGLTGADLAGVMNEGALLAARADKATIGQAELDEALARTLQAPERQRRLSMRARSVGKRFSAGDRVTFADVAGVETVIEELLDVTRFLAEPDRFAEMGAAPPRGVLLSGPPGCGKTLLARAVAGEANAAFISVAGPELVEVFVGEGAARVRDVFAEARAMAPAIVFIDEIDAVGGRRMSTSVGGSREVESTLNQILIELDGFDARSAVIVIAATNRPDMLDPALVRPGRFDRKVDVSMPSRPDRRAILQLHLRNKPVSSDVDVESLAGRTRSFSGADLANIVNEAALLATRRGAPEITTKLVDEAVDRAVLGVSSRRYLMTDEELRAVAYHEAGHALVAHDLEGAPPPYKLTIAPRGGALGHCSMLDSHDREVYSRSMLVARMAVSLGGYAAEKLVFGETSSGSHSDLAQAGDLARRMVCEWGMSDEVGPMVTQGAQAGVIPGLSEESAKAMRRLTDEAFEHAWASLVRQREPLDRVVVALLDQETLSSDQLLQLLGPEVVAGGR